LRFDGVRFEHQETRLNKEIRRDRRNGGGSTFSRTS